MSTIRIAIEGTSAHPLPALGHGLWVNHLEDVDAVQTLIEQLGGAHLELLVDLRQTGSLEQLRDALSVCQRTQTEAWLLVIVSDQTPEKQIRDLARMLATAPCVPRGILATPAAYLESYQPNGQWPNGPTPDDIAALTAELLPGYLIGGGVPTYFTELNRCRPAAERFDYLTHATSPIVHAADDLSVMESLQSLGDIARSARQLAHGKPYRLTTTAIGAWRNPYGGQLTPNPRRERVTLSDQDPRQRGQFAAAWTVAHYAAVQRAGVDAIALWAVNQPFAVAESGELWPIFHALRGLNRGRGKTALDIGASSAAVSVLAWREEKGIEVWVANLTGREQAIELTGMGIDGITRLDADTCSSAQNDPGFIHRRFSPGYGLPVIAPYGVLVLDCQCNVESGL